MMNDTPLEALRHKISLVPGTFRSEENSPDKISSEEQLDDLFTKGLRGTKFSRLQKKLMGW